MLARAWLGTSRKWGSLVDTIAPLEVAQAATQIYDGPPASESGSMCLSIYLQESRTPLGFCNRYVGTGTAGDAGLEPPELAEAASTDVTTAFSDLEAVNFAPLHVEHVVADIRAARGLREATILSARAPLNVKAGHTVRVRLLVQIYRGSRRTVTIRLRIPARAQGALLVAIHGPAAPAAGGASTAALTSALASALGSSSSSPPPPAPAISSIPELRQAIAGIADWDGLYAKFPGSSKRRVYRDPSLLITGRTELAFLVSG